MIRLAQVQDSLRGLLRYAAVAATATLVACGGPGGSTNTTTPLPTVSVTLDNATIDQINSATVTATVLGSDGKPATGQLVTFTTDAAGFGVFSPSAGTSVTDSNGKATIKLLAGPTAGAGTVTATYAYTTTSTGTTTTTGTGTAVGTVAYTSKGGGSLTGSQPASIQLLVSSTSLVADGTSTIALTAQVRDANNNTLAALPVTFSSDAGSVIVDNGGKTAANGQATATLTTLGDNTTRKITVTASIGVLAAKNTVQVSGTKISVSGVNSLAIGGSTKLTVKIQDGAGKAIANQVINLKSVQGNTISAVGSTTAITSVTTDSTGQATVNYLAVKAGTDIISATALNETGILTMGVSNDQLNISLPTAQTGVNFPASAAPEIALNTGVNLVANYQKNGVPQAGIPVTFSTTRGLIQGSGQAVTDASGNATIAISANNAGNAVITASAGTVATQFSVEFVATVSNTVVLQVDKATISPQGRASITATVRDPNNNLVKNKIVDFTVTDITGGSLSVAKGTTDSFGQTSTIYTAGSASSAKDAVVVKAVVEGTSVTGQTNLTVAGQSLFIRIGTGNTLVSLNGNAGVTQYSQPYSAIVTDAAGNPVSGAAVTFTVEPVYYYKGQHFYNGTSWSPISHVETQVFALVGATTCPTGYTLVSTQTSPLSTTCSLDVGIPAIQCASEDINNNGILDANEDFNHNGVLDPGIVVAANTTNNITDATGSVFTSLIYPKDHAYWVTVKLIARAIVQGTEASTSATFLLTGIAADYTSKTVSPPGYLSPYGQAYVCSDPK